MGSGDARIREMGPQSCEPVGRCPVGALGERWVQLGAGNIGSKGGLANGTEVSSGKQAAAARSERHTRAIGDFVFEIGASSSRGRRGGAEPAHSTGPEATRHQQYLADQDAPRAARRAPTRGGQSAPGSVTAVTDGRP